MFERVILITNISNRDTLEEKLSGKFRSTELFESVLFIGASAAKETVIRAVLAIVVSIFFIVIYIWLRFGHLVHGLAAIVALVHDVLFTIGAIALAGYLKGTSVDKLLFLGDIKINLPVLAAFLTIIGYSLNDTIVVFDRIRENLGPRKKLTREIIDTSINQTLSRTVLTSLTTLVVVAVLYLVGGQRIHGLAFALLVGVIVGTYSSIFIASPILVWREVWRRD
jgi:SecD/SecF fusion protein